MRDCCSDLGKVSSGELGDDVNIYTILEEHRIGIYSRMNSADLTT